MPDFMNLTDSVRDREEQSGQGEEEGKGRTAILGKSLSLSLSLPEQMAQVKGGSRGEMPPPQLFHASVV